MGEDRIELFSFFENHVDYDYEIRHYNGPDFVEFVVSRGGDVVTYRVHDYGNNNFVITER